MLYPDTRRRRLYVVGQISTGKSTLLLNPKGPYSNYDCDWLSDGSSDFIACCGQSR